MTAMERQILNNQCVIMSAIAKLFRNDGDDPLVIEALKEIADEVERTLDLVEGDIADARAEERPWTPGERAGKVELP